MTPAPGARAIGYCRVSTDEQGDSGLSLAAQKEAISAYCANKGWSAKMISEVASGTQIKRRPKFQDAVATLNAGKADVLVVTKLDRLSRSAMDALLTLDQARRSGWQVVILDLQVDTTTAMGQVFFTVSAAFAQLYRDQISENTRAALDQVRKNGSKSGRPIGARGHKRPRLVTPELIDRMADMRSQGISYTGIAHALNDEGTRGPRGGTWTHWSVAQALRRAGRDG